MGMGNITFSVGKECWLMWQYEKKLQYPVKIANPKPALAKVIISQLGGADFKKLYIKNEK